MKAERPPAVLIGLGNSLRKDDGAGLEVARRVKALSPGGVEVVECPLGRSLLEALGGAAGDVLLVDAMRASLPPGTVRRFRPGALRRGAFVSSHGFGAAQALALAASLGGTARVTVYGIQGADFSQGQGLSPEVRTAVEHLAGMLARRRGGGKSRRISRPRVVPCTNTR